MLKTIPFLTALYIVEKNKAIINYVPKKKVKRLPTIKNTKYDVRTNHPVSVDLYYPVDYEVFKPEVA